jgi:hypothetical protein
MSAKPGSSEYSNKGKDLKFQVQGLFTISLEKFSNEESLLNTCTRGLTCAQRCDPSGFF